MQRAYHTVILPDGTTLQRCVVQFDADGHPVSWHPLCGEEPFVEWAGTVYHINQPSEPSGPSEPLNF